ncbi:MAG: GNAT family N-acetyltransferase [Deltaproteobacteria bacterium]|nr:GNAT family N-acetyltransferase [Deltaproteobacteria bacterium]
MRCVKSESDWAAMHALRCSVERAFGLVDAETVARFVDDIRRKCERLDGQWWLARHGSEPVGEIGFVPFALGDLAVARLQDVDVVPHHQQKGFGNELLAWAISHAAASGIDALCLMAKADDWPKDWYASHGFFQLGET